MRNRALPVGDNGGVRAILIGRLDSLNQSALATYSLHTEIESRNKWLLFGVLREIFSDLSAK